jgi:hypothetical protein
MSFKENYERLREKLGEPTDYENFDNWTVTVYDSSPQRYFVTARHDSGVKIAQYCDRGGYWKYGTERQNRVWENMQAELVESHTTTQRLIRSQFRDDVRILEITNQELSPAGHTVEKCQYCVMITPRHLLWANAKRLSDGYKYSFVLELT